MPQGHDFITILQSKREFGNPYYLETLCASFGIRDTCSAFPREVWDPEGVVGGPEGYYEALAAAQARAEVERAAAQSSRAAVAFAGVGVQLPPQMLTGLAVQGAAVAAGGGGIGGAVPAPAGPAGVASGDGGGGSRSAGGAVQRRSRWG